MKKSILAKIDDALARPQPLRRKRSRRFIPKKIDAEREAQKMTRARAILADPLKAWRDMPQSFIGSSLTK